ncbi:MAG TPA: hypothetical protein PLO23_05600 [Alphaproteobacteria bacterium]|nr:hypothetical protein [Alphaproteobacteria bacterium]
MIAPARLRFLEAQLELPSIDDEDAQGKLDFDSAAETGADTAANQTDSDQETLGEGEQAPQTFVIDFKKIAAEAGRDSSAFDQFSKENQYALLEAIVPILYNKHVHIQFQEHKSVISQLHEGGLSEEQKFMVTTTGNLLAHLIVEAETGEFSPYSNVLYNHCKGRFDSIFEAYLTDEALEDLQYIGSLSPQEFLNEVVKTQAAELEDDEAEAEAEVTEPQPDEMEPEPQPEPEPIDYPALRKVAEADRSYLCRLTGLEQGLIKAVIAEALKAEADGPAKNAKRTAWANIIGRILTEDRATPAIPLQKRLAHILDEGGELEDGVYHIAKILRQKYEAEQLQKLTAPVPETYIPEAQAPDAPTVQQAPRHWAGAAPGITIPMANLTLDL